MKRRNFIQLSGLGAGALMVPLSVLGNNIPAEALLAPGMDVIVKKRMAKKRGRFSTLSSHNVRFF